MMNVKEIASDMTSRDRAKIRSAGAQIINRCQDEEFIQKLFQYRNEIHRTTRGLELGGAFVPNNRFFEFPIEKIDYHYNLKNHNGNKGKCTCQLYLKSYDNFNPTKQAENKSIQIKSKGIGNYTYVYGIQCNKCSRKYHASERHYHFIWYKWDLLTANIDTPRISTEQDEILKLYLDISYTVLDPNNNQHDQINFQMENLIYYREHLSKDPKTAILESENNWTDLLDKAVNDLKTQIKHEA